MQARALHAAFLDARSSVRDQIQPVFPGKGMEQLFRAIYKVMPGSEKRFIGLGGF